MSTRRAGSALAILIALLSAGCLDDGSDLDRGGDAAVPTTAPKASAWREIDASAQVALPDVAGDPDLAAAIHLARASAEGARQRWEATPPESREGWSVQWSAPTEDGGFEHLWVEPCRWSAFRVEGRLASPPQRPLACGRTLHELVGFPTEELVDWMHVGADGTRSGAHTLQVLEARFGKP